MKPPRHVYRDDGVADHRGEGRCQECGTPRSNERHEVPDTTLESSEHRRRAGEQED